MVPFTALNMQVIDFQAGGPFVLGMYLLAVLLTPTTPAPSAIKPS